VTGPLTRLQWLPSDVVKRAQDREMDLIVREVQPDDAAAVVAILNPIIATGLHTVFDTPFSVEAERAYIESLPERGVFLVAIDKSRQQGEEIVGFQSMEPFAAYTRAFDHVGVLGTYVSLHHRRQGVSRALFEQTFQEARLKGYEKIFTFVRADNLAALAAYLAQGFTTIGTARGQAKVHGLYVDEILIEKFL
jgi:L-amino acid N-acyltransferase YncA